jgi:hypothetical protein
VDLQTLYSDDVTLTSTQSAIQFSPRGTTDVAPTITITNSAGSKIVTVKITGAVTIS